MLSSCITLNAPLVIVPVLSKAIFVVLASASIDWELFAKIPSFALFQITAKKDKGIEITNAQGQDIIIKVRARYKY